MFKRCPQCGIEKAVTEFSLDASRADGLQFYCKVCYSARSARTYRERQIRQGRTVRERVTTPAGHKYCPGCREVRPQDEWRKNRASRDGLAAYCKQCRQPRSRADYLRRTFGLDDTSLQAMIDEQGGRCAICRDAAPQHIDHDHETGEIRGVLCSKCNMGLGLFDDDPARLHSAICYLRRPRRTQPLEVEEYEPPGPIYVDFRVGHRAA